MIKYEFSLFFSITDLRDCPLAFIEGFKHRCKYEFETKHVSELGKIENKSAILRIYAVPPSMTIEEVKEMIKNPSAS